MLSAGFLVVSCARGAGDSDDPSLVYASDDAGVALLDAGVDPSNARHRGGVGTAPTKTYDAGQAAPQEPADAGVGEADDASYTITGETADGSPLPATPSVPLTPPPPAAVDSGSGAASSASSHDSGAASSSASSTMPTLGGCAIFPANNPWNTRIDDPQAYPVHPNSATYIANMSPNTHLHADWGDWSTDKYGIPWQLVPGSQAMVPMTFDDSDESDPGPYPFPATARVEGGLNSGGDMHVLVLDTGSCMLYETYDSSYVGPGWSCGSGAKFDLTSNALRPDGWTSADAAGLPILPGLVRVAEVQAGAIRHALRFTVNSSQQGYIHPATHAAGKNDATLPPMGLRVRLKASFNVSQYTGAAAVILTAMQQYGLILADNGSNWFVSGDSDDGWDPLMDNVTQAFSQVTGSDFEAVQTGPISTDGL